MWVGGALISRASQSIATLVGSSNPMDDFRARYWMETFEVDRREEEDECQDQKSTKKRLSSSLPR